MEKTYLAEKERKIVEKAEEISDFNVTEYVGENQTYFNRFFEAQQKVEKKMDILTDYYKVWNALKGIKYNQTEANQAIDKKINDLIFKTYQEIEKLCQKFDEIKNKFDQFVAE